MDTLVAFDDDQLSVELLPLLIVLGDADKLTVRLELRTATVTVSVAVPPSPVAVMMYSVVSVGKTH